MLTSSDPRACIFKKKKYMIKILLLPYNYFCYNRKLNVFLYFET